MSEAGLGCFGGEQHRGEGLSALKLKQTVETDDPEHIW